MQFQYLVEAVLDDGVGDTCRDVGYTGSLSQHLFYLRVHKHGASGSQVTGSLRLTGEFGEVAHVVVHVVGEGLDEGAATRRTSLVEFHSHHGPFLHEDGFHVLSADVEDEAHVGYQRGCGTLVRHRLDDAAVQVEGCLDEFLAIARAARAYDFQFGSGVHSLFLEGTQAVGYSPDGVAEVQAVIGENNVFVAHGFHGTHGFCCFLRIESHGDNLRGGRSRVDADYNPLLSFLQRLRLCGKLGFRFQPVLVLFLILEEGLQTAGPLRVGLPFQSRHQICEIGESRVRILCPIRTPQSGYQIAVLRYDEVALREMHIVAKGFSEGWKEGEWTAAKKYGRLEVDAMGEGDHRLYGDGVEDAGCDVLFGQVARHEVLHVGLGEYTASCRHWIDVLGVHRQLAHPLVIYAHEYTHLVDEGTRASGAVAVHAQFHASVFLEEDHLGVLSSDVDERLCLGMGVFCIYCCRHYLLHKFRL